MDSRDEVLDDADPEGDEEEQLVLLVLSLPRGEMLSLAEELMLLESLGDTLALPLPDGVTLSFGEDDSLLLKLAVIESLSEQLPL